MAYLPLLPQRPIHVHEIYTVHYFEYAGSYAFSGESHDFWELLYVDRGTLRVTAGDQVWQQSRGQMIFHAPGEFHALSATGVAPDLVVVSFGCNSPDMNFFQGLITTAGEAERALLARIVEESTAAFSTPLDDPSTQSLQRREISPFGGEQLVCAALEELLIRLIRRREQPAPPLTAPGGDESLKRVASYMEQNLDRPLTLEEICRDNLIGRSQLQKLFHTYTGGGVMEYFGNLKIQAARRMIRDGRLNFTQIAARLGFQSVHYFSRRFRKVTGMSPSEYARSVKMLSELPGVSADDSANNV